MTEHDANAVADPAIASEDAAQTATTGMEAEANQPSPETPPETTPETPSAEVTETPSPKRRRKSAEEHPSLFAINLEDPELPSASMPFALRVEAAILLADRPARAAELAARLAAWRKQVGAAMPTPNPQPVDPFGPAAVPRRTPGK